MSSLTRYSVPFRSVEFRFTLHFFWVVFVSLRFGLACYFVVPVRFIFLLTDLVDRFYIMFFIVV